MDPSHPDRLGIDSDTKEWIDSRASWLLNEFGWQRIRSCPVIIPTNEFFPDTFSETEADARALLNRLCGFLEIQSESVELLFFREVKPVVGGSGTLGLYQQVADRFRVWIEVSQLTDPLALTATLVHELCHIHLLGHGRLTEDTDDHEPLTDLLTVFLGLGVITANEALRDQTLRRGHFSSWQISRRGYLTMPMFGYALALFAHVRNENFPDWSKHLRPDVRGPFGKAARYFAVNGLPDLHQVKMTPKRPALHRRDQSAEVEAEELPAESGDAGPTCTFCGIALPEERPPTEICDECSLSIHENKMEIEAERKRVGIVMPNPFIVFIGMCIAIMAVYAILIGILKWLEIVP